MQIYYKDPESALQAVHNGEVWGSLYFTENFTDALVARMALGKDSDEETLEQSEVKVWLDMSSKHSSDLYVSLNDLYYILSIYHITAYYYDLVISQILLICEITFFISYMTRVKSFLTLINRFRLNITFTY